MRPRAEPHEVVADRAVSPIVIRRKSFRRMLGDLHARSQGRREAGAFLLGTVRDGERQVVAVAFYDDLDPTCLTGGITFGAAGYTALNGLCRDRGLRVLADIHLHPGRSVQQSSLDAAHPMVAMPGHVALIAPCYGRDVGEVRQLGAHLKTSTGWRPFYGEDVVEVFDTTRPLRGVALRRVIPFAGRVPLRSMTRLHRAPCTDTRNDFHAQGRH